MKLLGLIGVVGVVGAVILVAGCDNGNNPFDTRTPVGQVCTSQDPNFDPSVFCKKGDIISYGADLTFYCDFNYQTIWLKYCVYVGEKRKVREIKQGY